MRKDFAAEGAESISDGALANHYNEEGENERQAERSLDKMADGTRWGYCRAFIKLFIPLSFLRL